jgi:hypothetical protein
MKMKLQTSKLAIGLLALLAFAGEANATLSISGSTGGGGGVPIVLSPTTLSFSLTTQGGLVQPFTPGNSGIINSFNATGSYTDIFTITTGSSQANLLASIVTAFAGNSFTETLARGVGGAQVLFNSSSSILAANSTYILDVNVKGGTGFSGYSMQYNLTSVPEPTESALLISGLGLVGFMVFRRKNNSAGFPAA